jgi:YspA, cpYpsA-related SLOG family
LRLRVIIAGSRFFQDYDYLSYEMDRLLMKFPLVEVVSGRCKGADLLGERWANERGHPIQPFPVSPADWEAYGKAAGPKRNREMLRYSDALVVFWNGRSRGSRDILEARETTLGRNGQKVWVRDIRVDVPDSR